MRPLIVLLVLGGFSACATTTTTGAIRADGFHHTKYPATLHFAVPERLEFTSPDWVIENFERKSTPSGGVEWKLKDKYVVERPRKVCDPSASDTIKAPALDLVLRSRTHDGRMWFTIDDLASERAETGLDVLARDYVAAFSGQHFSAELSTRGETLAHGLGPFLFATSWAKTEVTGSSTSRVSRIVKEGPSELLGIPAYDVLFEVRNPDDVKLDPGKVTARLHLILVQAPFQGELCVRSGIVTRTRPLMSFLYANDADYFDTGDPDFKAFVQRLEVTRK